MVYITYTYCRNFRPHPRLSSRTTHGPATVTRKGRRSIYLGMRKNWGLYKFPTITGFCLTWRYMTRQIALVGGWYCWGQIQTITRNLNCGDRVGATHIFFSSLGPTNAATVSVLCMSVIWRCAVRRKYTSCLSKTGGNWNEPTGHPGAAYCFKCPARQLLRLAPSR